jgi:hypothetical protein
VTASVDLAGDAEGLAVYELRYGSLQVLLE